ncbi:recombinase family protein [Pseudarthrobacter oxydans]|uniref:recombinase family protein n=1 Tax=Pseudarthrobacter oxydans TaxID=1671 RepID=UPI0027D80C8C|nr:recombinase family protein [Pseudarthrobacter oxydans]
MSAICPPAREPEPGSSLQVDLVPVIVQATGPMATAMLTIMAAFAQLERDTMIERTRAGLAAAAANNRHGGRPRKVDDAAAARAKSPKAKASVPPTSARCSESPAPRSTNTSNRPRGCRLRR